jgi:YrbI family 3-deoxy-D-manno-octulosonate 8-phosphate phosphatase
VSKFFLFNQKFLIHAKSLETFLALEQYSDLEVFYQELENVVLTTKNRKIFHSRNSTPLTDEKRNIWINLEAKLPFSDFGVHNVVLTDYPEKYQNSHLVSTTSAPFDLLILDIDGVMTDGTKLYGLGGEVLSKSFNDKDFTAIKRFIAQGVQVIFLSGDKNVNQKIAEQRGIPFHYAVSQDSNIDKSMFFKDLKEQYRAKSIAFIGDDYYDATLLDIVDYAFCPWDGLLDFGSKVKRLNIKGGEGVVASLFDLVFHNLPKTYAHDYLRQIH